jgi:hypothetical protein
MRGKHGLKAMKNAHNFHERKTHPITGKISKRKVPHTVLMPPEDVTLTITEKMLDQSSKLRGRGDSMRCPGACCVFNHQTVFPIPITGVVDFNYSTVHIQTDDRPGHETCLGYKLAEHWFPKENDKKGGIELLRRRVRDNGGSLDLHLTPIEPVKYAGKQGKTTNAKPRRPSENRGRGIHLRAYMVESGVRAE